MASAIAASASTASASGTRDAASERFTKVSAASVTPVISGTSVMANAPFMVWMARSNASLAGSGAWRAEAIQASTVSRCEATSASRISRRTLSTDAGVPSSTTRAGSAAGAADGAAAGV